MQKALPGSEPILQPRPQMGITAGIAIGPILFIIALLGVIVAALSAGTGSWGTAATSDRIKADLRGQANLIRAKVQECYMATIGNAGFDYPAGPTPNGTAVTAMTCPGDPAGQQNLWSGKRPASPPATPKGFQPWVYYNYVSGSNPVRCIILTPSSAPGTDVRNALAATAALFGTSEIYLNTGGDYSFSVWLTPLDTPKVCGT